MNYSNKRALVLGLGESGLAMARWLSVCGASVCVADTRSAPERLSTLKEEIPSVEFFGGEFSSRLVSDVDLIAISPGLYPDRELREISIAARSKNIPMWSEIELFAQELIYLEESQGYKPKVVAITGTNGKTTVTRLTGTMCERAGKTVKVAGNISPAVLDVLREAITTSTLPDVWVLELSSFQLWSTYSLNADVATVLNITQDHLDWHGSIEAYAEAKKRIFGKTTVEVLNRDDPIVLAMHEKDKKSVTFGLSEPEKINDLGVRSYRGMEWLTICKADDSETFNKKKAQSVGFIKELMPSQALKIRGRHNVSNALAALGLCLAIDLPIGALLYALKDYKGEPHRVETVMKVSGVSYIDDSKGTNVGATVAAVVGLGSEKRSDDKQLILILGGLGKGQDFSPLKKPISQYVKAVMLIGQDAKTIYETLKESQTELIFCDSLEEAVRKSAQVAKEGDMVLLSPACASMDMFKNYAHRSEVFISEVKEVALSKGEVV